MVLLFVSGQQSRRNNINNWSRSSGGADKEEREMVPSIDRAIVIIEKGTKHRGVVPLLKSKKSDRLIVL